MQSSISWQAYEYHHFQKNADWFWIFGIVMVLIILLSLLTGNIIFALFIFFAGITLAIMAHKKPKLHTYEINEKGVMVEKTFYPYKTLDSFGLEIHEFEEATVARLYLKSKKVMMPFIILHIADTDPEDIREYLTVFLPEEEHQENFGERLFEYLGF